MSPTSQLQLCISIKSRKTPNIQCNRKTVAGTPFCGLHKKHKILYNSPQPTTSPPSLPPLTNTTKSKKSPAQLVIANTRRFLVLNRKRCLNEEDFFTTDTKYEIPSLYFFKTFDNYCFDIRTLHRLIQQQPRTKNPYTMRFFCTNTITKYKRHIAQLQLKKVQVTHELDAITIAQIYMEKVQAVFLNFQNILEHEMNIKWFTKLSLSKLKKLYFKAEDIWTNEIQISSQQRNRMIPAGSAFNQYSYIIRGYSNTEEDMHELRMTILNEFNTFVSYSLHQQDRFLGAVLMTLALVRVSKEASNALPSYLIQFNS